MNDEKQMTIIEAKDYGETEPVTELPKASCLAGVSQSTLDEFLEYAGGNWSELELIGPKRPAAVYVSHVGRSIEVRLSNGGRFPPDSVMMWDLMGTRAPCDGFGCSNDRKTLSATLKIVTQVWADEQAYAIDYRPKHPNFPKGFGMVPHASLPSFFGEFKGSDTPQTVAQKAAEKKKNGKPIPAGTATIVMRTMNQEMPHGVIDVTVLKTKTLKHMTPTLDVRGADRNPGYVRDAIKKLIELEWLYPHGAENEQISLTALVEEAD
jgi:hypothetical protein